MKQVTLILSLLALGLVPAFGEEAPRTPALRFAGDSVELEMTRNLGRSLVQVHLGNSGPYPFFIDTGASVSVVDTAIAAQLGLEKTGSMAIGAPGGNQVDSDIVTSPVIRSGNLEIEGAELLVIDIAGLTQGIMHGILGLDLFKEVLLTIDPAAGKAILSRGSLTPGDPDVVPLDLESGRVMFNIDVAGRTVPAQIDTGSPGGITLPLDLMQEFSFQAGPDREGRANMVGGPRKIHMKTLEGTIRFANLEYENPLVGFLDPSPPTANIGSRFLDELVITVDQKSGLLKFVRSTDTTTPAAAPAAPRRLGIRFRGSPGSGFTDIESVDPGSLGEQAGFMAGDKLISLNGKSMSEYDQASLGALLRGTDPLRWEIERDGAVRVINIR